jgi:hypothetical protein
LNIYGVFTISCIFRRFHSENTTDCVQTPTTGGVRGGADGDLVLATTVVIIPPLYYGPRYLVVLRAYCDESYDKDNRVYVVAGFVGRDKDWRTVSRNWRNRCLKDGIECYHASDCESQLGDFKHFTVAQSISLNSDLIEDLIGSRIAGFGVGIFVDDYKAVAETTPRAKDMLRRSPYFLALQFLLVDLAAEIATYGNSPVAFIFEQQDEFSGQVKLMYEEIKFKNPESARCMGSLPMHQRRSLSHYSLQIN